MKGPPLILDFDGSALPVADDEIRLSLGDWQERIRFGCTLTDFAALARRLCPALRREHGCVFTGSGDFHHLSALLLSVASAGPLDLIVLDNHPDNMRYPFGIHCGSWVRHAARLPHVRSIHVLGICSTDIAPGHAWENYLTPFFRGKLTYWSLGVSASWLRCLGLKERSRSFDSPEQLLRAFLPLPSGFGRVYLSLDKDVFSPQVARTVWDQGRFAQEDALRIIEACAHRLVGADVCGDVSLYSHKSRFKRLLAGLDRQTPGQIGGVGRNGRDTDGIFQADDLQALRREHQALNRRLLAAFRGM
jgi:hypothetical protein